jgi:hypothetical protein
MFNFSAKIIRGPRWCRGSNGAGTIGHSRMEVEGRSISSSALENLAAET